MKRAEILISVEKKNFLLDSPSRYKRRAHTAQAGCVRAATNTGSALAAHTEPAVSLPSASSEFSRSEALYVTSQCAQHKRTWLTLAAVCERDTISRLGSRQPSHERRIASASRPAHVKLLQWHFPIVGHLQCASGERERARARGTELRVARAGESGKIRECKRKG